MIIPLYHMVRGHELGVPGANVHIGPLQAAALQDVPYIPWLNQHHCVGPRPWHYPIRPDVTRLTSYIEDVVLDETGNPISDFVYLNLENTMSILQPWGPDRGEIYRDCIYVAKSAMGWKFPKTKLFVYASLQGAWRRKQQPHQYWHAMIEPYVDALCLSLYGYAKPAKPGDWISAINGDVLMVEKYLEWYSEAYCHDRPRVLFVWGWHKGMNNFYPLDKWQAYIQALVGMARPGDVFCWFGAAKYGASDAAYGPQIDVLKALLGQT